MSIEYKMRSERNQTIILKDSECFDLRKRISFLKEKSTIEDILDKTFNQDLLDVIDFFPSHFADLVIIDPPYNLSKDFNGLKFKSLDDDSYFNYVNSWLPKVINLLKPSGSIYVCCDWKSSSIIYQILSKYVTVKNRITWQREKGRGAKTNWKNSLEDIWFGVVNDKDYYFDVESVMQKRKVIAPYKVDGKPKDWEETKEGNFRKTYPSNF